MVHPPGIFDVDGISIETALAAQWLVTIRAMTVAFIFMTKQRVCLRPGKDRLTLQPMGDFATMCAEDRPARTVPGL
jgi:hypothetical protein